MEITDITKLFVDLTSIYLTNPQDIRQDSTKVPVYLIGTGWLDNGESLRDLHNKPVYIRYIAAGLNNGGAIQIGVQPKVGDDYKFYYMAPVYFDGSNLYFEINLNEILTRDLTKGVVNNINIKFIPYINGSNGLITENNESNVYTVGLYPDLFSRTTVIDDLFLFNVYLNKFKEFITESDQYNKPTINIDFSTGQLSGLQYVSQYDDIVLQTNKFGNYYSLTCYAVGPEDADEPDISDPESFKEKFNLMTFGNGVFKVHLNEFFNDMVINLVTRLKFAFKGLTLNGEGFYPNIFQVNYYKTDESANAENIKIAFREIHKYI